MIEFRNGANWLPTVGGVAVLAWDTQIPVRTSHNRIVPGLRRDKNCDGREHQTRNDAAPEPSR